jgi:endonuclease/exonuclease/phosphatase family metal-dependent hydrolase
MDRLRVVTLNIWNKQGGWPDRLALIRKELQALQPDIVGLQEVLHLESLPNDDQAREIARDLGYYVAFAPAWDLGGGLKFGNAVLSKFPILTANNFQLPGEPGEETRSLLHAELDAPCGRVPVFVTHLDWQLHHGFVRERQVMFLVEKVKELAPVAHGSDDSFPPIVMGDFNAEPESDEIRFLKGWTTRLGKSVYFADCFGVAGDGSPGWTYARSNRFAAKACEPNRRIDYIFVRGPDRKLRGEPLTSRLVFHVPKGDVFPTDHYGVYAEIQAAPRSL